MLNQVVMAFAGFGEPAKNFSELPHELIGALPMFKSLAELKIVLYILRHTWGYHEYDEPKQITLDEFQHGRKNRKGKRIDSGLGMAKTSIMDGLDKAIEHGFIEVETNDQDKARIEKFYQLRMFRNTTAEVAKHYPGGSEVEHRTEKDTLENNLEENTLSPIANAPATEVQSNEAKNNLVEIEPLSTIQVRDSGSVSTTIPDSVTAFKDALEPKEKGFAEKEKVASASLPPGQYVPAPGFERVWVVHRATGARFEHLVNGNMQSSILTCERCKLKLNDGNQTRLQPPDANLYERCLGDEPKKARASPKRRKKSDLPASYGDLFVLIKRCCFNDANGQAVRGRTGKATLALLRDYPDVTVDEFQRFADDWRAKPNKPDFPCGTDSLPTNFGKWRAGQTITQQLESDRAQQQKQAMKEVYGFED